MKAVPNDIKAKIGVEEILGKLKVGVDVPRKDESKNSKCKKKGFFEIDLVIEKIINEKDERNKPEDRAKHNGRSSGENEGEE